MSEPRYTEPVPSAGVPETEEEAAERSLRQQEEDRPRGGADDPELGESDDDR
jgi:hypothetical protein